MRTLRCAPAIRQPTLVIRYTADACVFPEELNEIFEALGASDKELHAVRGTHHGQPLGPDDDSGQAVAGAIIRDWLGHRLAA